ncbi:T9SS type A sorting domain-containing protein [Neolewinella agarilytica]|uniref:Por secretion system C-terminal sorting domain-containing protein n=2 Tax=Neolewinella agarilytica TaxID=478744 RepID=A0A1H9IYC6_9BACT|nr:T9SS type A sorting domain-containing protein [Neolewinella agarilytica]SEQ79801.1 Por secretion system C-terminal sorting domain-containing protein [Neolewinella agarilytica]
MRSCYTLLLVLLLSVTASAQSTILDFEGDAPTYEDFNGSVSTIIPNPDVSEPNTSATVVQNVLPIAQNFAGIKITQTIDLKDGKSFTMKVWSPIENAPVLLKFEDSSTSGDIERPATFTGAANSWQELTFDFATEGDNVFEFVVVFLNFNVNSNADPITFYWDELVQVNVPSPDGDQMDLPVTFDDENVNYGIVGFEGAEASIVTDPTDAANQVGQVTKGSDSGTSAGATVTSLPGGPAGFASAIPFTASATTMSVRVWSPTAGIPVRLKVENAGDAGVSVETEATVTVAAAWDTLVFDFSQEATGTAALNLSATYNKASIFFDFGSVPAATTNYFFDDMMFGGAGGGGGVAAVALPVDFESTELTYNFQGFEGADSAIEANPDQTGENTSATVMRTTKTDGAQFFAGTSLNLDTPIDFSVNKGIAIQSWSPKADIPVRIRLEDAGNSAGIELDVNTTVAGSWETLTADFTNLINPAVNYVRVVVFYEFVVDLPGDGSTYYFDNIEVVEAGDGTPGVSLPVDFESTELTYVFGGFEGADSAIEANPDQTGENTSATVMRTTKTDGAQFFAGTFLNLDTPIDFSVNKGIAIQSWSPKADIPVRIRLEDAGNTAGIELDVNTTVAGSWETLTADFTNLINPAVNYVKVVVFYEFVVDLPGDGSTYYFDNIEVVEAGDGTPGVSLPVDFESTELTYVFGGFEGADSAIEANPDQTGENTSATVMRTTKTDGAQFFAGTFLNLDTPIDFSVNKGIAIQSWSPKADIPVRIRLEDAGNTAGIELDVNTTVAGSWETLTADFTNLIDPAVNYVKVVVFFEFVGDLPGDGSTYYFDNIEVVEITDDSPPVVLPVGFENGSLTYDFAGFEGADSAIEANPDPTGENTSTTVMRTTKTEGAQFFAGTFLNLDAPIDLSNTGKIVFSSWSPKANIPVRVRLEDAGNTAGIELDVNTVNASVWETLEADFSGIQDPNVDYVRIVIFYEFIGDLAGDGTTYYFDNLSVDELTSTRRLTAEEVQVFPNPTSALWQIASPDARIEMLELFDLSGRQLISANPDTNTYEIDARRLPTGTYIVRIATAEGRRVARLIKQ